MLASCQNGKPVLVRFVLHFIVTAALESHAGGCTSCVPAGAKPWPICSCWAGDVFRKGLLLPLILSTQQQKQQPQGALPFLLPIPALPLSPLMLLHYWEFLSCLGHREVPCARLDVAGRGRRGEGAEGWSKRA